MNRKTARENAFILLFEGASKCDETPEEIFEKATNTRQLECDDYVKKVLLTPLNLDASFRIDEIKKFENVSSTYIPQDGKMVLNRTKERFLRGVYPRFEVGQNYRGPAGGLFISAKDLMG